MILIVTLALVICFTNFVKLSPCTEEGRIVGGNVYVAFDAIQSMREAEGHCTVLLLAGGGRQFVHETPDEIIKLQENRQDPN